MNPDEIRARCAHPAGTARLRRIHLNDQLDAHAAEAIKLTEDAHGLHFDAELAQRMPHRARPAYDTVVAGLAGALVGIAAFMVLMIKDGAL